MNKSKITKIHKAKTERWQQNWDKFLDLAWELTPDEAREVLNQDEPIRQAVIFRLDQGEHAEVKKELTDLNTHHLKEIGLEPEIWMPYLASVERFEAPEYDKPELSKTPKDIPKPSFKPEQALGLTKAWTFTVDVEGLVKADISFCLAVATIRFDLNE